MIKLMCGNNWSMDLLKGYIELNNIYGEEVRIKEIFGSIRNDPIGCSREEDRLPEVYSHPFEKFIKQSIKNNIEINYTINKSCIGSIEDFNVLYYSDFIKFIKYLETIGVSRLTVAHPFLMELISSEVKIPIEVSTIAHTYSINQIHYYKKYNVDKICMNLMKNRDINFLENYSLMCRINDIELELMANEACLYGCPYRYSHYNQQSHTTNNKKLFNNYPIGRCTKIHTTKKVEWLKARLIRPEDMKRYYNLNISSFKITGRTHDTSTQLRIVEYYMKQKLEGNLLDLFPQFFNIYADANNQKKAPFFIPNNKLDKFLDKWFSNPYFKCDEHCEFNCTYCYDWLEDWCGGK